MNIQLPTSLDQLATPTLLVDVERLERNIASLADLYATVGVAARPHVKTSKCWQVASRQLASGASGFTCSTPAEVAWLRRHGVSDLLWAQQPVGPAKVAFVVETIRASGPFLVALDSVAAATPLAEAAVAAGISVPFLIEVDTGHGRAGVAPERLSQRARELAALDGLELRGIMTHEGHLARHVADRARLEDVARRTGEKMAQLAGELRRDGYRIDIVSVGSTPGATSVPLVPGITEARAGTYVYFDANQLRLGSATLEDCALTVLSRVITTQRDGTAIIDAGIKAMSSDTIAAAGSLGIVCDTSNRPLPGVVFGDGNEEHGFLTGPGADALSVGDIVRIVPNHACGTANMFGQLYACSGHTAVQRWEISARH